jgi:hypothetical protein
MALPDLLKAVRKPRSAGDLSNDAGIALADAELAWLTRLHDTVRNQFVHLAPMGWWIEVSGMSAVAALVARIVGDIAEAGWAFRHQERSWRVALAGDLAALSLPDWPTVGGTRKKP